MTLLKIINMTTMRNSKKNKTWKTENTEVNLNTNTDNASRNGKFIYSCFAQKKRKWNVANTPSLYTLSEQQTLKKNIQMHNTE